jgi:hypothetical protein
MNQELILNCDRSDIGLFTRNNTYGDEYTLVEQFIDYYCSSFRRNNKKMRLAVFVEPRIDSGFPDVVFASYLPSILDNWSNEREKLDVADLKVLSYLSGNGREKGEMIITKLGFSEKQAISSLEKLMDAKLVTYRAGGWQIRKLRDIFNIKKLIAVEAKLSDVSGVVDQSYINTRFASHSYALINSTNPASETKKRFAEYGIGLYSGGSRFKKQVEAKRYTLPSSYVSFQFNEWIGRAISH